MSASEALLIVGIAFLISISLAAFTLAAVRSKVA